MVAMLVAMAALALPHADAADQVTPQYRPLTLPGLLAREIANVVQQRQKVQASIAAASAELEQARAAYWRCHPNCPSATHENYARRLVAKDLWYLYKDLHGGPAGARIGAMVPREAKLDGDLHAECVSSFFAWKTLVASRAGGVSGVPGLVNTLEIPKAIEDTQEEYARYAECRDKGEYQRGPQGLSAAAVPAGKPVARAVRHALVCWPLHIGSNGEEMNPLPPATAAHYEAMRPRILQAAADKSGAVRAGAARGLRPILKVGAASSNEPPVAVEFAAEGLWWACRGGGRPQLVAFDKAQVWEAATSDRVVLICWPRHATVDRPIHEGGRGSVDAAPPREAAAHYANIRQQIMQLVGNPDSEPGQALRQGRVPRFMVGHADEKNEPALRVESVERVAGLPCERTRKQGELVPLTGS